MKNEKNYSDYHALEKEVNLLNEYQSMQLERYIDVYKSLQEYQLPDDVLPRLQTDFEKWLTEQNLTACKHKVSQEDFWKMMKNSKSFHDYTERNFA